MLAGADKRRKKMPTNKKNGARVYSVTEFSWPRLHTGKKWYIDFKCYDPETRSMRRKKYHLDGIKGNKARRDRAAELIAKLSDKLQHGWNVWADQAEGVRQYTLYANIKSFYIRYLEKVAASGVIKDSTYKRMLSYYNVFNAWLENVRSEPVVYVYQFKPELAGGFLDYMFLDLDVSACTRNNYLVWLSTFCQWMVDRNYITSNPCAQIKKLREEAKKREPLTAPMLRELRAHLERGNRNYLLACMLEYYCFIRPAELTFVRVRDIKLKEQKIVVHGEHTKNRRDGAIGLNKSVLKLMVELKVFAHSGEEYLFGTKDFAPGMRHLDAHAFRNEWAKVRKALRWGDEYQFYSLKDTGIRDLANAEGIVVARDQARHSDVSTTNKYLKGDSLTVHEETKRFEGGL